MLREHSLCRFEMIHQFQLQANQLLTDEKALKITGYELGQQKYSSCQEIKLLPRVYIHAAAQHLSGNHCLRSQPRLLSVDT